MTTKQKIKKKSANNKLTRKKLGLISKLAKKIRDEHNMDWKKAMKKASIEIKYKK